VAVAGLYRSGRAGVTLGGPPGENMKNHSFFTSGSLCLLLLFGGDAGNVAWSAETPGHNPAPADSGKTTTGKPHLTIACLSDLHIDYGIEKHEHPNRAGTVRVCREIGRTENADVVIVGGDTVSANSGMDWDKAIYNRVRDTLRADMKLAVKSGNVLYAAGNHEYQIGRAYGYNSYDFTEIMKADTGNFASYLYQHEDKALAGMPNPNYLLAYRYRIGGYNFIVVNPPSLGKDVNPAEDAISPATFAWLQGELAKCRKEKAVFFFTHIPLKDTLGMADHATFGGNVNDRLKGMLAKYPNVIYLYAHAHGFDATTGNLGKNCYIVNDTGERVTRYKEGMMSCFTGSMTYFKTKYDGNHWLTASTPVILQALIIYVYDDKVVFQMKNYGDVSPGKELPDAYVRYLKETT